jgi:hypothetical protein
MFQDTFLCITTSYFIWVFYCLSSKEFQILYNKELPPRSFLKLAHADLCFREKETYALHNLAFLIFYKIGVIFDYFKH